MQPNLLKKLLAVPSHSFHEEKMVSFIMEHVNKRGVARCGRATVDEHNNVLIVKGNARFAPCLAAHTDTVHRWSEVQIIQQDGIIFAVDTQGHRVGPGADDKTGIYIALELLERFCNISAAFFAAEEVGCIGARNARADFFERVGYVMEFDCPARGLVSYTSGGVRLFKHDGEFIKRAIPVLQRHGATRWQHHPYSDVKALRQRFDIETLNLSAGYRHWHRDDEFVDVAEVAAALNLGEELIRALGEQCYEFRVGEPESPCPPMEVTAMTVDEPEAWPPKAASR
jgi:putative aminopeptidase FrvX